MPRERGQPRVGCRRRHRAGHADRHVVAVPRAITIEVERCRPVPEAVDRFRSGHPGPKDDDRSDAAKVREVALEDVERDARRDARVDRVPALLEHARARKGREVMTRAHHVARREQRGPALGDSDRRRGVLYGDLAHGPTLVATLGRCGSWRGAFRRTTTGPTSWSTIARKPY